MKLPAAVEAAVSKAYPKATIKNIKRETENGQEQYEIESVRREPLVGHSIAGFNVRVFTELARLSTRGRQVVVPDSDHMIPLEAPESIVEAIRNVVADVRAALGQ